MTTLIITDEGFYSDGRNTAGGDIVDDNFQKAYVYKGIPVALVGDGIDLKYLAEKMIDGDNDPQHFDTVDGTCYIRKDGVTYSFSNHDGILINRRILGTLTMGSGADYARSALDFGKTPEEAIEYAATRDCYTGGKTFSVMFEDLE